ncbi:hypothetical protein M272_10565 [Vibrio natriegens NBRC 15636 = ATCC 14048 = DSM 759]|nr:hypothetical protein M272_10565 [Vibrio natriegens NBRC 15636 = ATCC 14048 = DSM 759]
MIVKWQFYENFLQIALLLTINFGILKFYEIHRSTIYVPFSHLLKLISYFGVDQ